MTLTCESSDIIQWYTRLLTMICDYLLCIGMYAFFHVVLFLQPDIYLSLTLNFRLLRASKDSSSEHDSGAYIEIETSVSVIERGWKLFVPSRLRGIWAVLTRRSVSPCSFLSLLALYPGWWVERLTPSTSMVWRLVPETGYALCAAFVLFFLTTLYTLSFLSARSRPKELLDFHDYWNHLVRILGFQYLKPPHDEKIIEFWNHI